LTLQDFSFSVMPIPGSKNFEADILSRLVEWTLCDNCNLVVLLFAGVGCIFCSRIPRLLLFCKMWLW
jgi:hypothetical protein